MPQCCHEYTLNRNDCKLFVMKGNKIWFYYESISAINIYNEKRVSHNQPMASVTFSKQNSIFHNHLKKLVFVNDIELPNQTSSAYPFYISIQLVFFATEDAKIKTRNVGVMITPAINPPASHHVAKPRADYNDNPQYSYTNYPSHTTPTKFIDHTIIFVLVVKIKTKPSYFNGITCHIFADLYMFGHGHFTIFNMQEKTNISIFYEN